MDYDYYTRIMKVLRVANYSGYLFLSKSQKSKTGIYFADL